MPSTGRSDWRRVIARTTPTPSSSTGRATSSCDVTTASGSTASSAHGRTPITVSATVVDERVPGLDVYQLPERLRPNEPVDVLKILDELHDELRELGEQSQAQLPEEGEQRDWIATPDHVLYVTVGIGKLCPATEPDLPPSGRPVPARNKDENAGDKVTVSVVDTGWYADAAADSDSTWLASGVQGDAEVVDPNDIHEYAGHGTFVAGIIRCLAPATTIEVEGVPHQGWCGARVRDRRRSSTRRCRRTSPTSISISAGTHTYQQPPLLGFEALCDRPQAERGRRSPCWSSPRRATTPATQQFWPAAFDWVVAVGSLDADGKKSDFSNYGPWVDVYAQGATWSTRSRPAPTRPTSRRPRRTRCVTSPVWPSGAARRSPRRSSPGRSPRT